MKLQELDEYFKRLLFVDDFANIDYSQNGLQVANSGKEIKKIVFALDACMESIKKTKQLGGDMLFVHHGLFWGKSELITGVHYNRIKALIDADIALYAVHLPLDAHVEYGNNAGLVKRLQLTDVQRFGNWRGVKIGLCGNISDLNAPESGVDIHTLSNRLFPDGEQPIKILPFGKKEIKSVGIISGGASDDLRQAIDLNLDAYITGELKHKAYNEALDNHINVIAGGHYQTETVGVQLVAEKLRKDTNIETMFIDLPTGI